MKYYALSDIHGCYDELKTAMTQIDLDDKNNIVIFCGDYIDGNAEGNSMKVLYYIYELQKKYKERVIVLRGNHEQWFAEYIEKGVGQYGFPNVETLQGFMSEEQFYNILTYARRKAKTKPDVLYLVLHECKEYIKKNHKELVSWIKSLPFYYETENQIYVHAGIEEMESCNDYWKECTDEQTFLMKHTFSSDDFYKDIISGHASSAVVANDDTYLGKIYKCGNSHYYIDGNVLVSKQIPVLVYDVTINKYEEY